jgi:deoxyribodipyrimidine photolyase-related protein
MAEPEGESTRVWSSQVRTALFLSAMRHFAAALMRGGDTPDEPPLRVDYLALGGRALGVDGLPIGELAEASPAPTTLPALLGEAIRRWQPQRVVMLEAGEWQVREDLRATVAAAGLPLDERADRHFLCRHDQFQAHAQGKATLQMERFYRAMRRLHGVLMEADGRTPVGGAWNFDAENRESFGRAGPGLYLPAPPRFEPDAITRQVIAEVRQRFADHPGRLDHFAWPLTRTQALVALDDFIAHRLADFGRYQDAIWAGEPWLYHSALSAALNLHLLDPREVIARAEAAWRAGAVPLASAEGFIRQILGWREYVRGVYWLRMPTMLDDNALGAHAPLPAWYWTGQTDMACLREAITQTLDHGYAHHIQRLMVTGLYALLLGVEPRQVHAWYLAVYVDAVEWVEAPNTLGMSQHADGGYLATKPYVASGRYIERMSNHCRGCRYRPGERTGPSACPFTTLYWDFLLRHEARFAQHPRLARQWLHVEKLAPEERAAIRAQASVLRQGGSPGPDHR